MSLSALTFHISVFFFIPPLPEGGGGYTVLRLSILPSQRHIGRPYCGQQFWTCQILTSCLPTSLVFIHIEHICTFFVTFFSATIDGRNLIFGHKLHICTPYRGKHFLTHQIPTSCLPKSGGIISEHQHFHLVYIAQTIIKRRRVGIVLTSLTLLMFVHVPIHDLYFYHHMLWSFSYSMISGERQLFSVLILVELFAITVQA